MDMGHDSVTTKAWQRIVTAPCLFVIVSKRVCVSACMHVCARACMCVHACVRARVRA